MKRITMAVATLLVGTMAFGAEPTMKTIRTFRGGQEGYVRLRDGEVIEEYIPAWRPNAAQQAAQYEAGAAYYRRQDVPEVGQPAQGGPGFNTFSGSWIQDKQWIQDGPAWVAPLDW